MGPVRHKVTQGPACMSQLLLMREDTIGKTPKVELRVTETQLTYNDHRGGRDA